ncbi:conserved domain protein [Streptococcus oralis SK313]|uniref:Conserved domain protein n=1 Tax=Streptococcus oralis SK313 TaxID=1035190 RepID=F9Q205_STROR|nr:conserved domain protein [Streptococcus oralis SK313]
MYSQDLSNCTTYPCDWSLFFEFLYSQDLSNCTTCGKELDLKTCFCTLKI